MSSNMKTFTRVPSPIKIENKKPKKSTPKVEVPIPQISFGSDLRAVDDSSSVSDISNSVYSDNISTTYHSWNKTKYTHDGNIIYLVVVDSNGKFVAPFEPLDYIIMKPMKMKGDKSWMQSYIFDSKTQKPRFPVACDNEGNIIDGLKKQTQTTE
ncbi:Uncharacterized protein QTN25_000805 [Entamoeba marina]